MGKITLELYTQHAPRACENFRTLASRKYYDNTIFHRIIPGFMIQGGDPSGTGRGGSAIYAGGKFADEIVLSMANSGKDTNGSQFFITLAPTPWLDGKHTIFGRVKAGLKVVQRIGLVPTSPQDDRPLQDVAIGQ
ncbi:hypothetical protein DV738_g2146, partial [Chaetothyriales sp. CBS 135597]